MSEASDILLGMGNSLDYDIHWRPERLSEVAAELGIVAWPGPPPATRDERDLVSAVLAYNQRGCLVSAELVVGQHEGNALALQQVQRGIGAGVGDGEDHAVHPMTQ